MVCLFSVVVINVTYSGKRIIVILRISMVWLNIVSYGWFLIIGNVFCF